MSKEIDNTTEDDTVSGDYRSIDLNYQIFSDEKDNTVYLKFIGFENPQQMENFIDYIDFSLPLLLHQSDIKH